MVQSLDVSLYPRKDQAKAEAQRAEIRKQIGLKSVLKSVKVTYPADQSQIYC